MTTTHRAKRIKTEHGPFGSSGTWTSFHYEYRGYKIERGSGERGSGLAWCYSRLDGQPISSRGPRNRRYEFTLARCKEAVDATVEYEARTATA